MAFHATLQGFSAFAALECGNQGVQNDSDVVSHVVHFKAHLVLADFELGNVGLKYPESSINRYQVRSHILNDWI